MSSVEKPKRQKAKETSGKKSKEQKESTTKEKQLKINDFNDLIKQQTQVLAKLQEYMERLEANEQKMESMLNEKK